MKVAIVGSRDFTRLDWVREYVDRKLWLEDVVVSGGARGVDSEAAAYARESACNRVEVIPADWSQGKAAGKERNFDIIEKADRVVAFWDGMSSGTAHSIALAVALGKPVEVYSTHPRLKK